MLFKVCIYPVEYRLWFLFCLRVRCFKEQNSNLVLQGIGIYKSIYYLSASRIRRYKQNLNNLPIDRNFYHSLYCCSCDLTFENLDSDTNLWKALYRILLKKNKIWSLKYCTTSFSVWYSCQKSRKKRTSFMDDPNI